MKRIENLKRAIAKYGVKEADEEGVEEDWAPVLVGAIPCGRFCVITRGENGSVFAYPTFNDLDSAWARAREYIGDDLYEEVPVAVVDLDDAVLPVVTIEEVWKEVKRYREAVDETRDVHGEVDTTVALAEQRADAEREFCQTIDAMFPQGSAA